MSGYPSELEAYLTGELLALRHEREMFIAMDWHEAMWGVPCGPTLTMVNPPQFRGLKYLTSTEVPGAGLGLNRDAYWRSSVAEAAPWSYARLMEALREAATEPHELRPTEPIVLHPKQYERWKANGWIK